MTILQVGRQLRLSPIGVREACAVVKRLHRHLPRIVGGLFACSLFENDELVGVAVETRAVAEACPHLGVLLAFHPEEETVTGLGTVGEDAKDGPGDHEEPRWLV